MSYIAKNLRAQRAEMITAARALIESPNASAADNAAFDDLMSKADVLKSQYERIEKAAGIEAELSEAREIKAETRKVSVAQVEDTEAAEKVRMARWLAHGMNGLNDADRALVAQRIAPIQAAGSTSVSTAGGYTIAPAFQKELLVAMKAQGGVRSVARNLSTETGVDLAWPKMDDTSRGATIIGTENTTLADASDLTFGSVTLKGWTYRTDVFKVSLQLLQDSAFDFDTVIRDAVANAFVRGTNAHFTTGTGTNQPEGVMVGAPIGVTAATGGTTSVTYSQLLDLQHSVDPVYRRNARWMMHDSSVKVLRKLVDSTGRPIWQAGLTVGEPDTLLGAPYTVNQDCAAMAANALSIAYGDFSSYIVRDILGIQIVRLNERYADALQIGIIAFSRCDGRYATAAAPVKTFKNSAT